MAKITQKRIISGLEELKNIKPSSEWVIFAKSQIFEEQKEPTILNNQPSLKFVDFLKFIIFKRKLAYSVATLTFMIIGLIGFAEYTMPGDTLFPIKKLAERSEAALTLQSGIKHNVVVLNNRINDLALATKEGKKENIPSAISEINVNASELAKNLKENSIDDISTIKDIASGLKTLTAVEGTDLTVNTDIQDIIQSLIIDLEKTTLTEDAKEKLDNAKKLYEDKKYNLALEEIFYLANNQ